uniref:Uncharacterized protein n=1 Tax=Rhodnius prolixus TaxID=13249 RepID=T1HIY7_RHOPR
MQPDDCINTVETLLSYSQLTFDLCKAFKTLIPTALKIKSHKNLSVMNKLFSHKDFPMVPVDLIEEIITLDSTQLELLIVELYSKQCNQSGEINLWNSETSKHWVYLCSVSPKLFYVLISIMNLVLVAANNRKAICRTIAC